MENFTLSFVTTFAADKMDPKVNRFFLLSTTTVATNLNIAYFQAFTKSHENLLKPTSFLNA